MKNQNTKNELFGVPFTQKVGTCDLGYGIWDMEVGYGKVNAFRTLQYVLGSESYMNNISGTTINTTGFNKWVLLRSCVSGLPPGTYINVKRYEIEATINHSNNESIIATANGLPPENINYGYPFAAVTNLSVTSSKLTSYVYELFNSNGQSIGFVPVSPSNLRFNVRLYKKMEKDLYLKNLVITNQTTNFEAINHIETQNVSISGNSTVNFHAGNSIEWQDGTDISPSGNGIINAFIEPFILGECEPNSYLSSKNNFEMPVFINEYEERNEFVDFDFILYPNPTDQSFIIRPIGEAEKINEVQVFNLMGQILFHSHNYIGEDISLYDVKGIQFVKIITSTKVVIKKILIH